MKEVPKSDRSILIIDDDVTQVMYITHVLNHEGYNTGFLYEGGAVLNEALRHKYDLILLDLSLPGIDGFEVCTILKGHPETKNIPVILISGIGHDESIYQRGYELGIMDYLKKPVTSAELIFKVGSYLRRAAIEEKIHRDELLLRSVIDDQLEFFVRYKPDGTLVFANPSFCSFVGKVRKELIGANFFDLLNISETDEFRSMNQVTDVPTELKTIRVVKANKEILWHQWVHRRIIDNRSKQELIQSIGNDITEAKKSEEILKKYEYIFNHTGGGIIASSRLLRFDIINEAYARMHGYTVEELMEKKISAVFKDPSDKFVINVVRLARKTGHYSYRSIHRRKDGTEFPAFSDLRIIKDENGKDSILIANVQDITESIAVTKSLAESEERFHTIFMNSPDIMVIFKLKDMVLVDVNDMFTKGTGLKKEEVLNKPYTILRFLKDPKDLKDILQLVNENPIITNHEIKLKTVKNSGFTALVSWARISLNGSDHVIATVRDIEDMKKIQDSLQKSETKFRLVADYNYNWEFWLGPDGKFIYVSPSCERVSGYKSDEFEKNPGLMMDLVHPDFLRHCEDHFSNGHCDTSPEFAMEFIIIDRFGDRKWLSHNCYAVYDEKGKFLGRRGNNIDITQKKQSENEVYKLSTAIEQSSSAVIITDIAGIIEYVNPYFEKLTGYKSTEAIGKSPSILKSGKTDPKIYDEVWESITSGRIWEGEFLNKKKNGELYIEHAIITPVRDWKSKIVNYMAIKQDITKQKEMDRKILQTIISTEEKERGRLSQDLHDDLGPLLSTAKLYIKSLENSSNQNVKQIAINKSIEAIDVAILSIKEIANNLSPHVLRNFGLIPGINSLINKINETGSLKIVFKSYLKDRIVENVESSVFRVVAELLNNTIKHASAKRVDIVIETEREDLIITYFDDGCGFILQDAIAKNQSRGLSNIINRVKSHGGEITFGLKDKGFSAFIVIPVPKMVIA